MDPIRPATEGIQIMSDTEQPTTRYFVSFFRPGKPTSEVQVNATSIVAAEAKVTAKWSDATVISVNRM